MFGTGKGDRGTRMRWVMFTIALSSASSHAAAQSGDGDVQKKSKQLTTSFARWAVNHQRGGGDRNVVVALGWSKGLSKEYNTARGLARLNLIDGTVQVQVAGLEGDDFDVWLVDNQPRGSGAMPAEGDVFKKVGRLKTGLGVAELQRNLGRETFVGFDADVVVVTEGDASPDEGGLLFGMPTLFQRLQRARSTGGVRGGRGGGNVEDEMARLIREGKKLFHRETFAGNGRTCGTCHREENNFTIDPAFIATLPATDPLFVAEFVPALSENFEDPDLMRRFGLILANTNGFSDLETNFTMRSVPHTLAMRTSLNPSTIDGTTQPPLQRTGWSGDGAPGSGTLREFAIGAVTQHFTLTLDRTAGEDFRLPTDGELDAMEAYQLSLGRQEEIDLSAMEFVDANVQAGVVLFNGDGKCASCHFNAGANLAPFISATPQNANFDTGVEAFGHPAALPADDGFGAGSGTFNTTTLVEAADTGPFFHNNSVNTIEEAVDFYNSEAFNQSPGGVVAGGVDLSSAEVQQVAALLRVLNALENIRSATQAAQGASKPDRADHRRQLFSLAVTEVEDAIGVLAGIGLHSDATQRLVAARESLIGAARARADQCGPRVSRALQEMKAAETRMARPAEE